MASRSKQMFGIKGPNVSLNKHITHRNHYKLWWNLEQAGIEPSTFLVIDTCSTYWAKATLPRDMTAWHAKPQVGALLLKILMGHISGPNHNSRLKHLEVTVENENDHLTKG